MPINKSIYDLPDLHYVTKGWILTSPGGLTGIIPMNFGIYRYLRNSPITTNAIIHRHDTIRYDTKDIIFDDMEFALKS